MSILDRITGKKETTKKKASPKKKTDVLDMVKEEDTAKKAELILKSDTGRAHHVLMNHHLSEKTNTLSGTGTYVFRVNPTANKIEVKQAVERVYDVHVVNVNILNIKGKVRRQGRQVGRTSDWKKAIVTLKTGEKITGLAEGV